MQRGTELEPEARAYYELIAGPVQEIGFCIHDDGFGCSPDGVVGDGLLEIKCSLAHTHVEYLREGVIPSIYIPQVQGQMLVMDKQWCDFLSYHPDMKPLLVRVNRDDMYCALLHEALKELVENIRINVEASKCDWLSAELGHSLSTPISNRARSQLRKIASIPPSLQILSCSALKG